MNRSLVSIFINLLFFSCLFSQEVFFEKGQSGFNFSYFHSFNDQAYANSFAASYVFGGKVVLHGCIISTNQEVNFGDQRNLSGSGFDAGVGFIARPKNNIFSIALVFDYSSINFKPKHSKTINLSGFTSQLSVFKIFKISDNYKFSPELLVSYSVKSTEFKTDNNISYGFAFNLGYFKTKYFGPSIGIAVLGSEGIFQGSIRISNSIGNLISGF